MNSRQRTGVPGVQRLQQIVCLPTAHLADDNPIWSMAQCRPQQITNRYARKISLVAARLEANKVSDANSKFCRVLNYDYTFICWQKCGERIQQGGLPCASATADQNVLP